MAVGSIPNAFTKARSGGDSFTGKCNAIESACTLYHRFCSSNSSSNRNHSAATAADA